MPSGHQGPRGGVSPMPSRHPVLRRWLWWALLATSVWARAADGTTIRISNGEWPPFMGEKIPHHGFVSRIVSEAFRLEGVEVEYEFYPWARAYHLARNGAVEASIGWYRTAEREQEFLFSEPVFVESQVFFFLKDKPLQWSRLEDLRGQSIGATLGYTYGKEFEQLENSKLLDVQRTGSDFQNLQKLLAGRVQAVVLSRAVGIRLVQTLRSEQAQRIAFDSRPINSGPLHVIFPKSAARSAEWLIQFNRGLKKLKATGAVDRFASED